MEENSLSLVIRRLEDQDKGLYTCQVYISLMMRSSMWMRSIAGWLEFLTDNVKVATVLGSISASPDTAESEGRQMKQYLIQYFNNKNPPFGNQLFAYQQENITLH